LDELQAFATLMFSQNLPKGSRTFFAYPEMIFENHSMPAKSCGIQLLAREQADKMTIWV